MLLVTDRALARRLERTEARANAAFVESRARHEPVSGAGWIDVDGTFAMFDGVGSPITQSFGLGLFTDVSAAQLDAIEAFFDARGASTDHETCPLADAALLALLPARGYRPIEQSTVLWQPLPAAPRPPRDGSATARAIAPEEIDAWVDTSARGWGDDPAVEAFVRALAPVTARAEGTVCFAAELDGALVGTGALALHDGVALLAGASTVAAMRGRGAQAALLATRLQYAAAHGADLAMMVAAPGSTSQTNAERQGFRVGYTRTKWQRPCSITPTR